jgi:integrase/recombinase XerD
MIVHIFTRHSPTCPQTDPAWKRCRCVRWVDYSVDGVRHRESTKKRSWEQATVYARRVEAMYAAMEAGEQPKPKEPCTVAWAVSAYLSDARSRHLAGVTVYKLKHWLEDQMLAWCRTNRVHYLHDLTLERLREWRSTWTDSAVTSRNRQSRVISFLKFCTLSGWIAINPAAGLSKIKVNAVPTDYFRDDEFDRVLEACEKMPESRRLRTLVLLMRWSGLSIQDAATFERDRLTDDDRVFLYRAKTGVPVHVRLPPDVADEIRSLPVPPAHSTRYFFWSGNGTPKSIASAWQKKLKKLFERVRLKHPDGTPKRAHSHMFRDTFAVNLLICGVGIVEVAALLGHSSINITQKHYAPWVQRRQDMLDEHVRLAWKR